MARPLQLPPQPLWLRLHCDVSAQRNRTRVPFCQSFPSLTTSSLCCPHHRLIPRDKGRKKMGEKNQKIMLFLTRKDDAGMKRVKKGKEEEGKTAMH